VSASPVFGPMISGADVETAMVSTLQAWLPTYLAELERRTGRAPGDLPMPRSWRRTNRFYRYPADQLPAAIVVSPGTADKPEKLGDGTVNVWWRIGIVILCSASTPEATNELAKLYAAALRTIIFQEPSLAGDPADPHPFANSVRFVGETTDDVPAEYLEIGATAQVEFDVLVTGIVDATLGPLEPTIGPPPDWSTVETQHVEIEVEDI
jgi:hypothetical protein